MKSKHHLVSFTVTLFLGFTISGSLTANASLADWNYKSGHQAYVNIHKGKSTLSAHGWKYDHIDYSKLDHLGRTSGGNTAYVTKKNLADDSLRKTQTIKPTGFYQNKIDHHWTIQRGHEIAYTMSKGITPSGKYNASNQAGDQNNGKNLFAQTPFCNVSLQERFENRVKNAMRKGYKVIYQVTPIFKGNNLMAKGVHLQAISTNKKLNFNVYAYNVQPGVKYNYATGKASRDSSMRVPKPKISWY